MASEAFVVDGGRPSGALAELYGEMGLPVGLPLNSTSNQFEASRVVKSGAGHLFGFSGFNNGAAQFVLAFDTQTALANGAVPALVVSVGAASVFSYDAGRWGRVFHQGIVLAASSTAATLTLAGATLWLDAQYI